MGSPDEAGTLHDGQRVRVLDEVAAGNPRTPAYLRGWTGTVVRCHGVVENPLDHRQPYPPLYSVLFDLDDGRSRPDQVLADLHEEWLVPEAESG
jgi:hypothetical protein